MQVFSTIFVVTLFLSRTPNSRTVLQKGRPGGKTHHDIALLCVCVEGGGGAQLEEKLTMTSPCFGASPARDPGTTTNVDNGPWNQHCS